MQHRPNEPPADLGTTHQFHGLQPVLPVTDVVASVAYYRDTLGFESDFVWGDPPDHGRVMKGDRSYGDPVYIHFSKVPAGTPIARAELRVHVGHDLDGLFAAYRERGVEVLEAPSEKPWGLREFSIRDRNGHVLCFCGYPSTEG